MDFPPGLALLQHHRQLTSRLAGRLGRTEAEDLASEALARGLDHPAPDGRQAPWIERIFRNLIADRGRRRRRRGDAQPLPALEPPAPAAASPEDALLAAERRRALAGAIPRMAPELQAAVIARFYEDREYTEMAAACGITAATARTRVHRGVASLRRMLGRLAALLPVSLGGGGAQATVPALSAALATVVMVPVLMEPPRAPVQRDPAPLVLAEAAPPAATRGGVVALPAPPPALPSPAPAATAVPMTAAPAPAPAPARRASGAPPAPRDTEAVKHYDFEDDAVEGTIKRPDGDPDTSTIRARHKSLIEIPDNFIAATAKMVEDM